MRLPVFLSRLEPAFDVPTAELFHRNFAAAECCLYIDPVAIHGVDDRYSLAVGQGGEIAIVWIEADIDQRLRKVRRHARGDRGAVASVPGV